MYMRVLIFIGVKSKSTSKVKTEQQIRTKVFENMRIQKPKKFILPIGASATSCRANQPFELQIQLKLQLP
jgi:hypothetical protein